MKYPLDKICIKSGVYCSSCQRKIDSGEVTSDDIEVLKALIELEDKLKFMKKGEFIKAVNLKDKSIVFVRNEFTVEEKKQLEEELSSLLGKKVRVVEYIGDLKKLIEQILYPATLYGINRVWIPGGSEIINIRVSRRDRKFIKDKEEYEELIAKIFNTQVKIVFE
ncbi:MAG: transcription elongation factor [Desulfurococcaceae archaeon]